MIGTAGHVDHGKTSLVKQLTGINTDPLPEEKQRGLSINLGFAPMFLDEHLVAGLVDVPGHEKFIRNMIAGTMGLDLILLVVAADDSIMPQTREHLFILDRLGIKKGLVVLNKIDAVDEDTQELAEMEIRELLEGSFLGEADIIRVSALKGTGIDTLKEKIYQLAKETPTKSHRGFFRLPVQRVFSKEGFGCIVTGIPFSGRVKTGDELELLPSGERCRVRSIQAYGKDSDEAEAGHSVALNLSGLDHKLVSRGNVLAPPKRFPLHTRFQGFFKPIPKIHWPKDHSEVAIYIGTSALRGKIVYLGEQDPEGVMVQLRLDTSAISAPGDHFIVRDASLQNTLGGGPLLEACDQNYTRKKNTLEIKNLLKRLKHIDDQAWQILTLLDPPRYGSIRDLEQGLLLPHKDFEDTLNKLLEEKKILICDRQHYQPSAPESLTTEIESILKEYYDKHPQERWVNASFVIEAVGEGAWKILQKHRSLEKIVTLRGTELCLKERLIPLNKNQRQWGDKFLKAVVEGQFSPPNPDDIWAGQLPKAQSKLILQALVDNQEIMRLSEKTFWSYETWKNAVDVLHNIAKEKQKIEISDIKTHLNLSRKITIPFLEATDIAKITYRDEEGNRFLTSDK